MSLKSGERVVYDLLSRMIIERREVNLIDVIAALHGWLPIDVGITMTVGYEGKKYNKHYV